MRDMEKAPSADERRADLSQAFPEIAALPGDPYNSRYCTLTKPLPTVGDPVRNFLKRTLPRDLSYTEEEKSHRLDAYLYKQPPKAISPFVDTTARFIVALVGGAALIIPVLVMSLHATLTSKLLTLTIAVLLFSLITAVGLRATNPEILVSAATYAAVLVVFVGTSGS